MPQNYTLRKDYYPFYGDSIYFTDYIQNTIAKYTTRRPNEEELEIILHGINLARCLTNIPSITDIMRSKDFQNHMDSSEVPNINASIVTSNFFKHDPTIEVVEVSARHTPIYRRMLNIPGILTEYEPTQKLVFLNNSTWNNITHYYSLRTLMNNTLELLIQNSISNISSFIFCALRCHNYFKQRTFTELQNDISNRIKAYPNQPIYVYIDGNTWAYLVRQCPSLVRELLKKQVLFLVQGNHIGLFSTNFTELVSTIGIDNQSEISSYLLNKEYSPASFSAIVAAGQMRINHLIQDEKALIRANENIPNSCERLTYKLREWIGIRVEEESSIEDPTDSFSKAMSNNRLDNIGDLYD